MNKCTWITVSCCNPVHYKDYCYRNKYSTHSSTPTFKSFW
nr:MAG TPA: MH1 domain [Caudoviricetes sp.]